MSSGTRRQYCLFISRVKPWQFFYSPGTSLLHIMDCWDELNQKHMTHVGMGWKTQDLKPQHWLLLLSIRLSLIKDMIQAALIALKWFHWNYIIGHLLDNKQLLYIQIAILCDKTSTLIIFNILKWRQQKIRAVSIYNCP